MSDRLMMPPSWSSKDSSLKAACAQFESMLRARLCKHQIVLLAGQFRKIDESDASGGCMLYLAHFRHGLWLPPGLAQGLENSVRQWAGGLDGEQGDNRFVLTEIRAKSITGIKDVMPDIECIACSVERFSKDWIPIDSRHEQNLCDKLVAEGREFAKPFTEANRKDWISGLCNKLGVVPDFVMTDRKPAVFMEVLGRMNEADYQLRTAAKMAIYQRTGRPVWSWDVLNTSRIPELP